MKRLPVKTILLLVAIFTVRLAVPFDAPQQPSPVFAQADPAACDSIVREAIREIGSTCRELGRNEACYGNTRIDAELSDASLSFADDGDIVSVANLVRLTTQPADPDTGEWGIAVIDLQADLPESSAEGVRLLLFGGLEVEPSLPAGIDREQPTCTVRNTGGRGVNFRTGPSTDFEVVDSLRPSDEATVYGISADGGWYRGGRGWISAEFTADDCAATDLVVIEETSDAYFAPMQNFTLTLGQGGSCETAPTGLLIQAPDDQTANIMINNVELRIGSTAFVTVDEAGVLEVGNIEGDVTVTANGASENLNVGNSTLMDSSDENVRPAPQAWWSEALEHVPDELLAALPTPVERPQHNTGNNGQWGETLPAATSTGVWGACGSCNTCGHPQNQCVSSPDGQCLWDPTRCTVAALGNVVDGRSISNPGSHECAAGMLSSIPLNYDNNGTGFTLTSVIAFGPSAFAVSTGNTINLTFLCPAFLDNDTILINAEDSGGAVFNFSFTIVGG